MTVKWGGQPYLDFIVSFYCAKLNRQAGWINPCPSPRSMRHPHVVRWWLQHTHDTSSIIQSVYGSEKRWRKPNKVGFPMGSPPSAAAFRRLHWNWKLPASPQYTLVNLNTWVGLCLLRQPAVHQPRLLLCLKRMTFIHFKPTMSVEIQLNSLN